MRPIILFFLIALAFAFDSVNPNRIKLPVAINYRVISPPDSVKIFVNAYFQSKKIQVIDPVDARNLVFAETAASARELIMSDNLNSHTAQNLGGKLDAVCNMLSLIVYADTKSLEKFRYKEIHSYRGKQE